MSDRHAGWPVLLPTGGMEMCRLYAAASLFFLLPELNPLPLLPEGIALFTAVYLSLLLRRLSIRRITDFLLHITGFLSVSALVLKGYAGLPFHTADKLSEWIQVFSTMHSFNEWFSFSMIIIWTGIFWLRGRGIGRKELTHSRTLGRFDTGIFIFLYIYFLRTGIGISDPHAVQLVASYLIFGIFALFAARNLSGDLEFAGRRSTVSLLLLFSSGFMLFGAAVVLLYPLLSQTAGEVYTVLADTAAPLKPWLIEILRFIFGMGFSRPGAITGGGENQSSSELPLTAPDEPAYLTRFIGEILMYGLLGILILLFAGILLYVIWRLIKVLAARSLADSDQITLREFLRDLFFRMKKTLLHIIYLFRNRFTDHRIRQVQPAGEGVAEFRNLVAWGRRSGILHRRNETAAEYGKRISDQFPSAGEAVALITRSLELEYYGNHRLSREHIRKLQRTRRSLRRPGLIPARIIRRLRPIESNSSEGFRLPR